MTQQQQPPGAGENMPRDVRKEEEAADRARGRSEGSGAAPKLDEMLVPEPEDAPLAGRSGDEGPASGR